MYTAQTGGDLEQVFNASLNAFFTGGFTSWGGGGSGASEGGGVQVACSYCSGLFGGTAHAAEREELPPLVYRFGVVSNPSHSKAFRELFNPSRGDIQHLMSPTAHRQSLAPQWGVDARINNQNIAKMESALRVHVNDPRTQVIYGTSGPQKMTAIHFYNQVTGRVVTINPITGGLRSPTGFTVSSQQADSLANSFHLGTR